MDQNTTQSLIADIRCCLSELETALKNEGLDAPTSDGNASSLDDSTILRSIRKLHSLCDKFGTTPGMDKNTTPSLSESLLGDGEFLAITLRSIIDAVISIDSERRVILLNQAAEALTGWNLAEAAGKPVEEILRLFEERNHARPYNDYCVRADEKEEHGMEHRALLRSRDNKEHMVTFQCSRICEQGKDLGIVLVLRDISKSYFLEEEVLKIRKLESVGVLAGGIAHDFNNLLTGITTNLFMARMSVVGNSEACSLISEAEKAAFKATTLTKQLLSFARGGPSIKELASIKQLIQDTVGFCLSGSNVDYRLELPDDLWQVDIDKGQIDQVLNNLILNAAQSMPQGGTVTIGAENMEITEKPASKALPLQPGKYVKVRIRDEGTGIAREYLERIFDPYFSTRQESTGLGLSTSYSIIKRHGGHVYVESAEGKGSVFIFLLPVSAERDDKKQKNSGFIDKGSGRVLIMDDDMIVRTVVETLLKKAGYTPVCVTNGEQALQQYREALSRGEPFTVTIMDLTIPGGMGGKETIKRLREIDTNAKVIVFSGYSNDPIFSNFKEYGFDGVLSKPFSIDEFMKTITAVLQQPR
jgi:PAS domain S-box-containing protein